MSYLVLELQKEASSSNVGICDLLKKALIVAKKLKILDFEKWINNELNGYDENIPQYRMVSGRVHGFDIYRGIWLPIIIEDPEIAKGLSCRNIPLKISEIEAIINNRKSNSNSTLGIPYPQEVQNELRKYIDMKIGDFQLFIQIYELEGIMETIRNIVLNWTLKLEEDGILGKDMGFSENEKQNARKNSYIINNFYGGVTHSQIQQDTEYSNQNLNSQNFNLEEVGNIINQLKENIEKIALTRERKCNIDSEISNIEMQLKKGKPNTNIIIKSMTIIRDLLKDITGNVIASGIIQLINQSLGIL